MGSNGGSLPLYESNQLEAKTLMRPSFNVLSPSNGEVILKPTQDMVIGYYLTLMIIKNNFTVKNGLQRKTSFNSFLSTIHTPILVRYPSLTSKLT